MCVCFQICRLKSNPQCIWGRAFGRWLGPESRAFMNRVSVLIKGPKVEAVTILFSWVSKSQQTVTAAFKLKKHLLLGRKAVTNLDSILESRDITLPTKVQIVKAIVFPVVMYGYESWTTKKAEHQGIDTFKLWCWRRLLDSKEIKPVSPKGNQP